MGFMNFVHKVENFVRGAEVKVSDAFVSLFGKDNAKKFGEEALVILKSALGKIATQVVADVEAAMPGASGAQKQAAASSKIADVAKSAGITAASSIINLLIELAVAAMKGGFIAAA